MKQLSKSFAKEFFLLGSLLIVFCALILGKMTTHAKTIRNFDVEATFNAETDSYDIQIEVPNPGEDFTGIVRVLPYDQYNFSVAYDTAIVLPAGSKKKLTVSVPKESIENGNGDVVIKLINNKGVEETSTLFGGLLQNENNILLMGILSDNYSGITYMDLSGNYIYSYGESYNVKTQELTVDTISAALPSLKMLTIDHYDTSVLSPAILNDITAWVNNGGILIVGTGEYADKTLTSLNNLTPLIDLEIVTDESRFDQIYRNNYSGLPFSQDKLPFTLAMLNDTSYDYISHYTTASFMKSYGNGAVTVTPYALEALPKQNSPSGEYYVLENFLTQLVDSSFSNAHAQYNRYGYSDNTYVTKRLLAFFTNFDGASKFVYIVIILVIFVVFSGPILYLLLKKMKKQEFYWILVPIISFFSMFLIFTTGTNFKMSKPNVYGTNMINLSNPGTAQSFLYAFNSHFSEWELKLNDSFYLVAPLIEYDDYNYHYENDCSYRYHIQNENNVLSFGINPRDTFSDSYFLANKKVTATALSYDVDNNLVVNNSDRDMTYIVIALPGTYSVYRGPKSGETLDLNTESPIYSDSYHYGILNSFGSDFISWAKEQNFNKSSIGALCSIAVTYGRNIEDESTNGCFLAVSPANERSVNDSCTETSYDCFYQIIK